MLLLLSVVAVWWANYEGRPIKKLQNGFILLIIKILKNPRYTFVWNLFLGNSCECKVIFMTSLAL